MIKKRGVKFMARVAILGAMAIILMFFEIPLPFLPPFYKIDLSEIPVLVGAFALGPFGGVLIEFVKILGNLCFTSTSTMFVGEFANFLIGISYVVPASLIYQKIKTKKGAIIGNAIGILTLTLVGCILNAIVLLPAYSYFMNVPINALIDMGSKVNPLITNLPTFVLFGVAPFNIIKGVITSFIVLFIYKPISFLLHDEEEG